LTIAPPLPPCFVDMRLIASRAQRNAPTTLVENMRCRRSAPIASTRDES
jgi:hypothetical protein